MSQLKNKIMKKIISLLLALIAILFISVSCKKDSNDEEFKKVLIIYDDAANANSISLKSAIEAEGFEVVFSEVSESEWDNTNPSLTGFYGVIHMNGTTSTTIMPIPAQTALVDFVKNKGGHYVQAEWDGYQLTEKQMLAMRDIILLDREELNTIGLTYTVVAEQKNHPVLKDIPGSFAIANANSNGKAHVFAVSPSVVLIKEGTRDGVVVREFGKGKILGFNHAGNFSNQTTWSDTNIQKIVVNFFKWK